jgi:hypothetical protein
MESGFAYHSSPLSSEYSSGNENHRVGTYLAFPAFLAGWDNHKFVERSAKCRENLGGYLGVNGRQKRIFMDTVDKSMILMIASIHKGLREIVAFS